MTHLSLLAAFIFLSSPLLAEETATTQHHIQTIAPSELSVYMQRSQYLILDVYADWCGPCKLLTPILQELSESYKDRYTFAKIDGSKNQAILEEVHVTAFPTLIFFKDGKEGGRLVGFSSKSKIEEKAHQFFD